MVSRFKVRLKLSGLEIEIEGDREYAPQIAENIGRQLSQIIQPVALIEAPKTGQGETILAEVDGGRDRTSRRKRQGTRSAVSGSGDAALVTWTHDAGKWGTPRQDWKANQKIAWMLYVIGQANGTKSELTTVQIANAFNGKFRSAGGVHQGNVSRDLKSEPDLFGEIEGKWFLKDKGIQTVVERLLPEATGAVPPSTA
jgi:hypothetical protein